MANVLIYCSLKMADKCGVGSRLADLDSLGSGYMKKVKDPDPGSNLVVTIFNNKCKTDGKNIY